MDFLANQFTAIWEWLHTLAPIPGLSFALVAVVVWLPFNLWEFFRARRLHQNKRYLQEWAKVNERLKSACERLAGSRLLEESGDLAGIDPKKWENQKKTELYKAYRVNPLSGCFSTLSGGDNGIVIFVAVLLGGYYVLEAPQLFFSPGSELWSALCGSAADASACAPGSLELLGLDLRRTLIGRGGVDLDAYELVFSLWVLVDFLREPYVIFSKVRERAKKVWFFVFIFLGYLAFVVIIPPSGLLVLALIRYLQRWAKNAVLRAITTRKRATWDREIDAALEAIQLPEGFFEPKELFEPTKGEETAS